MFCAHCCDIHDGHYDFPHSEQVHGCWCVVSMLEYALEWLTLGRGQVARKFSCFSIFMRSSSSLLSSLTPASSQPRMLAIQCVLSPNIHFTCYIADTPCLLAVVRRNIHRSRRGHIYLPPHQRFRRVPVRRGRYATITMGECSSIGSP